VTVAFKDPLALIPGRVILRQSDGDGPPAHVRAVWRVGVERSPLIVISAPEWVTVKIAGEEGTPGRGETLLVARSGAPGAPLSEDIVLGLAPEGDIQFRLPVEFVQDRAK
jgi:hypothetical protein